MKKIIKIIQFFYLFIHFFVNSKNPVSPLEKITEFRQQHRKTLDGRLCAAAFLHDNQTYTNCTDAISPDGTSGREWCYVEVQLLGKSTRDWDYCSEPVNYDKLRIRAKKVFEEKVLESDRLNDRLNVLNNRVNNMLQKFDSVCGKKHELISTRIEKINEWLTKSEESIDKIEEHANNIESTKNIINKLQTTIKEETLSSKHAQENCENSPGYENEPVSDGLNVSFFTHPLFQGLPIETSVQKNVNFIFSNRGPIENISPFKYGIQFNGFLLVPHTGTFIFTIESDCAFRLFINNKCILKFGLEFAENDPFNYSNLKFEEHNDEKTETVKKISKPVELIGGQKHKFFLEVSHSSHLKFKNPESSIFKIFWKSSRIDEQVIQSQYFFSENVAPPIRVSNLNPELFEIGLIDKGENVFKNNNEWVISNVADKFIGLHSIRTEETPQFNNFSLSINIGSNLFLAIPKNEPLSLSPSKDSLWKVFDTEDILEIIHKGSGKKKQFKIKFIPLKNRATLNFNVLNKTSFIFFPQQRKIFPAICSGEEEILSNPSNKVFKGCTESSALTEEFNCIAGLNTVHMDRKNMTWRTLNNSIGEFIHVHFKLPVQINKFRFKPRDDLLTWPSEISLIFDDTQVIVPILFSSNIFHNTFKLDNPIITTSVKLEITEMFVNNNETGGSFEFLGNVCDIKNEDLNVHHATIDVTDCNTTLNNIPDILPLLNGDKFIANCDIQCIEKLSGEVFGSDIYAAESNLCKAAVHSGFCNVVNKNCKFLVLIRDKQTNFVGSLQNNVISSNLNKSSSLSFTISSVFSENFHNIYSSTPNSYSIFFKTNQDFNLPNKFLIDSGDVFRDFGNFAYGWKKPISTTAQLNITQKNTNPLYSGGIIFPSSSPEQCISEISCESNFWKFKTHENGLFTVQIIIGNNFSDETQNSFIEVNGLPIIKNVPLKKDEFFVAVKNVQITDRFLILTSTCKENDNKCSKAKTTLFAIQIVKV